MYDKHVLTGPKRISEFYFPRPSMFPEAKPRGTFASGNIKVEGKNNSLFPVRPVIKCFVIPPGSKVQKNREKIVCFTPAGSKNLPRFQGARPDHVRVESF